MSYLKWGCLQLFHKVTCSLVRALHTHSHVYNNLCCSISTSTALMDCVSHWFLITLKSTLGINIVWRGHLVAYCNQSGYWLAVQAAEVICFKYTGTGVNGPKRPVLWLWNGFRFSPARDVKQLRGTAVHCLLTLNYRKTQCSLCF